MPKTAAAPVAKYDRGKIYKQIQELEKFQKRNKKLLDLLIIHTRHPNNWVCAFIDRAYRDEFFAPESDRHIRLSGYDYSLTTAKGDFSPVRDDKRDGKHPKRTLGQDVFENVVAPIPDGYCVGYVDGNPLNCLMANLRVERAKK